MKGRRMIVGRRGDVSVSVYEGRRRRGGGIGHIQRRRHREGECVREEDKGGGGVWGERTVGGGEGEERGE